MTWAEWVMGFGCCPIEGGCSIVFDASFIIAPIVCEGLCLVVMQC